MDIKKLKICVIGSGSFGTALGTSVARSGHNVFIICRNQETIDEINNKHTNSKYFPKEIILPDNVKAGFDVELKDCDLIIHAVPVQSSIEVFKKIKDLIPNGVPYMIASKGILLKEKKFFSQIWDSIFPPERKINHVIISGPSFAIELMKNFPTLILVACKDIQVAKYIQTLLSNETFRIYITDDVLGVEIGGALKNVIAIIAGLVEGLGYRYNTLSALVTRGVFEISLFSKFYGGRAETLYGLSGIGDIMLSALGDLSRNKKVGIALAKGETMETIISKATEVAEGVPTLKVLHEIIQDSNLHMPLCETIYKVAYEKMSIQEAMKYVMLRDLETETELEVVKK